MKQRESEDNIRLNKNNDSYTISKRRERRKAKYDYLNVVRYDDLITR